MRNITIWLLITLLLIVMTAVINAAPKTALGETKSAILFEPDNKVLDASWQRVPPVVDGDLSDWETIARYVLDDATADYPDPSQRPTPEDLSAWTSMVWDTDAEYLYVALYVVDDIVYRQSRNWRNDDLVGYSFDMDRDGNSGLDDVNVTVSPDGLITRNDGFRLGIDGVAVRTEQGWQAEFSIPLHEFGEEFLTDAQVGFTWGARDNDDDGSLQWLGWAGPTFLSPSSTQGDLAFVDGPTREWREVRPGNENYQIEDSVLNSWGDGDDNYGEDTELGIRAGNGPWHIVMKMGMPELPPDAKVIKAELYTNVSHHDYQASFWVRMYPLLRPWDEGSVTFNNADASTPWAQRGAEKIGVDRAGDAVDQNELVELGEYVWEFDQLAAEWYEYPENNHGFLLRAEEGVSVEYRIDSSERGGTDAPWFRLFIELPPPDATASSNPMILSEQLIITEPGAGS